MEKWLRTVGDEAGKAAPPGGQREDRASEDISRDERIRRESGRFSRSGAVGYHGFETLT